ncbi:hypothetical protein [Hyunsoonleella rubra]|uniref:Outer membrane protein beta-barrel domain-containing protein n=1 Tax=Hyunsoonleella rubra TaxID=1737062 RepID=A0ABW5TE53_9FLAO
MKSSYLIIIFFLISGFLFSQNDESSKLKFKSWSIVPLEIYGIQEGKDLFENDGGIALSADLSVSLNNNVFSFLVSLGQEFVIWGDGGDSFSQINLLYGREFEIKKWLFIETHAGGGLLIYKVDEQLNNYDSKFNELVLPLVAKIRFQTGRKFSIGLKMQYNLGSFNTIYSGGLLLQFN